ncbi:unnamed protein product, partial [Oikopleura dioica]
GSSVELVEEVTVVNKPMSSRLEANNVPAFGIWSVLDATRTIVDGWVRHWIFKFQVVNGIWR